MARLMGMMPEREYRYRTSYDQRQGLESNRYYAGSPYGERNEGPYESRKGYGGSRRDDDDDPDVIELMVPMCCDKCREKVEEELGEVEGVENVYCDQDRDRVTVTGNDIDTERLLVKAKRAVKKECELISGDSDDEDEGRRSSRGNREYYVRESSSRSSGRPSLGRMPSFASGRTVYNDGAVALRGRDYEEKDYSGFRRMPSLRYHEAEYITSFNQRPVTDSRRDYYNVRRMPSFRNHRYHDAEYVNTGDLGYAAPRSFYEDRGTPYTTPYEEQRPVYRSQVSFSRLPGGRVIY